MARLEHVLFKSEEYVQLASGLDFFAFGDIVRELLALAICRGTAIAVDHSLSHGEAKPNDDLDARFVNVQTLMPKAESHCSRTFL